MKNYYHERIIVINKCFALVVLQTIWLLFGEYAYFHLHVHDVLQKLYIFIYYAWACNYPFILFCFSLSLMSPHIPSLSSTSYSDCSFKLRVLFIQHTVSLNDDGVNMKIECIWDISAKEEKKQKILFLWKN